MKMKYVRAGPAARSHWPPVRQPIDTWPPRARPGTKKYCTEGATERRVRSSLCSRPSIPTHVIVLEVKGADLSPELRNGLRALGPDPAPGRTYALATTQGVADRLRARSQRRGERLRDAVITHLERQGFPQPG